MEWDTTGERLGWFLRAYRSLREGHDDCVDGGVAQQEREARAEPLGAREGMSAWAEEQRRPEVMVGKAARELKIQKLQDWRNSNLYMVICILCCLICMYI